MPPWVTQAVEVITKYGKRIPWAKVWAVVLAIANAKRTVEKNLTRKEQSEFYALLRKARSGRDKVQPWRNVTARERAHLWELARKAAGFGNGPR